MIPGQSYCFLGLTTIYFFFFLLPFPNTFASSPTQIVCRPDQRDALLEIHKDLYGTTSLNKGGNCCFWHPEDKCDTILGVVISLDLSLHSSGNKSLKSSSIFKLNLTHLDLSYCHFQGEFPSSIGNLSRLTFLDLSYNNLVGEIPASISNLNQLEYMDLLSNGLKGNVPTSFSNLTKLSELNLYKNQFTSGVDLVLPTNLTSLSIIDLSSSHFQSSLLVDLSGLQNLERISGYANFFVGKFPSSLFMIASSVQIDLSQNLFIGSFNVGNTSSSSKLIKLDVGDNNFDGFIPESISSKLSNLQYLDLSGNIFKGQVPRSISKLVNLASLILFYNMLEGQVPLWRPLRLQHVVLSHNSFNSFGNSVESIDGALMNALVLGSNSLHGPFPQWICKFEFLSFLNLSNNYFIGPRCLKSSVPLQELNLRSNSFSGFLPDFFINGFELESLDLTHNNFEGKLPKSLINCKNMEFLNVQGNKIKNTFPFWLGSLQNFVGSLPQDYFANWLEMSLKWKYSDFNMKEHYMGYYYDLPGYSYINSIDLVYKGVYTILSRIFQGFKAIDFSDNRFCGHIPKFIGLLSDLGLLNLSGNTFTSNIPSSLVNITTLEALDLSRNNLSGEIPQGLGKLSFLSIINFSYNHLEGLVPQSTQFGSQKCSSFMGNPKLYGLEKICGEIHHVPVPTSEQHEDSLSKPEEQKVNWIAAAIAFGHGVFCGLVIGHIFTSYKHKWFILG